MNAQHDKSEKHMKCVGSFIGAFSSTHKLV